MQILWLLSTVYGVIHKRILPAEVTSIVQNLRNGTNRIPFFLILYYTYLNHKINLIFPIFQILLKFYQHIKSPRLRIDRDFLYHIFCIMQLFSLHQPHILYPLLSPVQTSFIFFATCVDICKNGAGNIMPYTEHSSWNRSQRILGKMCGRKGSCKA